MQAALIIIVSIRKARLTQNAGSQACNENDMAYYCTNLTFKHTAVIYSKLYKHPFAL